MACPAKDTINSLSARQQRSAAYRAARLLRRGGASPLSGSLAAAPSCREPRARPARLARRGPRAKESVRERALGKRLPLEAFCNRETPGDIGDRTRARIVACVCVCFLRAFLYICVYCFYVVYFTRAGSFVRRPPASPVRDGASIWFPKLQSLHKRVR